MTKDAKHLTPAEERKQRVADELRANLLKRRMQAKARHAGQVGSRDAAVRPGAKALDSKGKAED
jgi:hypothetical protein